MTNDADLDKHLRAWAEAPLPTALSARTLTSARAAFDGEARGGRARAVALTAAVVSAVVVYLSWAVEFLGALARS